MPLVGWPLALSMALVAVLISVATVVFWNRVEVLRAGRWAVRLALLSAGQISVVLLAAVILNNTFVFYQSWSELFGQHPQQGQSAAALGALDARLDPQLRRNFLAGRGTLASLPVAGLRSGVHAGPATVYLPPQYGDPAYANRTFPVVELLSGFPGGPHPWVRMLHVVDVLDGLIATGRAVPFIAVMPEQNVAWPRDTECVNVVGGPQVDTYLSKDVRAAVVRAFRAAPTGTGWTLMGDSTGGYCASSLAFRHPDMFAAAVSLAGYNAPAHDATTGNLFPGDPQAADDFSPLWMLQHGRAPDVALLLISTRVDRASYRAALRMAEATRPPLRLSLLTLPRGGHNFATFAAEIPVGFSWLSHFVATALAPLPKVDGLLPRPVGPPQSSVAQATTCVGRPHPSATAGRCPTVRTAASGHPSR
jgi:hypothetical protein